MWKFPSVASTLSVKYEASHQLRINLGKEVLIWRNWRDFKRVTLETREQIEEEKLGEQLRSTRTHLKFMFMNLKKKSIQRGCWVSAPPSPARDSCLREELSKHWYEFNCGGKKNKLWGGKKGLLCKRDYNDRSWKFYLLGSAKPCCNNK